MRYGWGAHARRRWMVAAVAGLVLAGGSSVPSLAVGQDPPAQTIVFNGEGNRLWVYDAGDPSHKRVLIQSQSDSLGANPHYPGKIGLDINAQICAHEFNGERYFIAGEDTNQDSDGSPGWGWFQVDGDDMDDLEVTERGKLIPHWKQADGQENYGCSFIPGTDLLLLSDVGGQQFEEEASGQLHLWFPDATHGFEDATNTRLNADLADGINVDNRSDGDITNTRRNPYCMIDRSIATAGGIAVDDEWAYVSSNRPRPNGVGPAPGPGGVYRYPLAELTALDPNDCDGDPSTVNDDDPATVDDQDIDLVAAGIVHPQLWLPSDVFVSTPSAIVSSGRTVGGLPTWYVSSVFTGVIAEYVDTGTVAVHLQNVVGPPVGVPIGQFEVGDDEGPGTPYGITVRNGYLWWADLGITSTVVVDDEGPRPQIGPADGEGSFQRVAINELGLAGEREVLTSGLDFPDGTGWMVLG